MVIERARAHVNGTQNPASSDASASDSAAQDRLGAGRTASSPAPREIRGPVRPVPTWSEVAHENPFLEVSAMSAPKQSFDNLESLWMQVLASFSQEAMSGLNGLREKVTANTRKKKMLRNLQGKVTKAIQLEKKGPAGNTDRYAVQADISKIVAAEPWLQRTDVRQRNAELDAPHTQVPIPLPNRLSNLSKAIDAELENVSDLGDELSLQVQLSMSRLTRSQQLASNMQKRFHDTAMAVIGNIRG